jgi:peptidyl-prolyl cis-trans isomerase C
MIFQLARAAAAALMLTALPLAAWAQGTAAPAQKPAAPAASAPAPGGAGGDPVVATVNGSAIHRSEVEGARQDLPAQYQQFPLEMVFTPLVERLIDGKLLTDEARKQGLADDPEVKQRLARLQDQVIQAVYLSRVVKTKITDDVLQKRYQEYLKANPPETEVHARHILVKTEDEAKQVVVALQGGAKFEDLAKSKSTGPSAGEGGDLGFIKRGDVVPEFADAAFALKPGQYTEKPVKTQFGWHVIKVDEVRTSSPPKFDDVKDELEREASRDAITELVDGLRKNAQIVRFNPDGSPKAAEPEKKVEPAPQGAAPDQPAKKKP